MYKRQVELVGMAPHFLMDHTGFQDTAPVRKMAEDRGLTIGCFTPECAVYQYLMCSPDPGFHERSMEYFKWGLEAAEQFGATKLLTNCIGGTWDEEYDRVYELSLIHICPLDDTTEQFCSCISKICRHKEKCILQSQRQHHFIG